MDNCNELNSSGTIHSNKDEELMQSINSTSLLRKDDNKLLKLNSDSVKNKTEEYTLSKHSNKVITVPKEHLHQEKDHYKSTLKEDQKNTFEFKSLGEDKDAREFTDDKCLQLLQSDTGSSKTHDIHNLISTEKSLNSDDIDYNVNSLKESQEDDLDISSSNENVSSLSNFSKSEASGSASCNYNETVKPQYPLYKNICINPIPNDFDMVEENNLGFAASLLNENSAADIAFPYTDNSVVISNSNALPHSENVVSSNYSLTQLCAYGSDESLNEEQSTETLQYRKCNEPDDSDKDSDSDSSSTSSSTSILITDSSETESDNGYENCPPKTVQPVKARGELTIEDLPPIEDLKISVPEEECTPIGKIFQIVDQLVVVQAMKDMPAYDLETVLFTQGGQPLGKIFDVFGPVTEPYYCIRFNSRDHIKEKNISLDQMVYSAPKSKYTNYVFLAQLMKLKGSDASWENDDEPPEMYLEYSDDEQERIAKKKSSRNKKAVFKVSTDPDEPARKRHSAFEKRMNARNLQVSAMINQPSANQKEASGRDSNVLWEAAIPAPCSSTFNTPNLAPYQNNCHEMFGRPPVFNTRAPPPNVYFPQSGMPSRPMSNSPDAMYRPRPPPIQRPSPIQRPPPNFYHPNTSFEVPRQPPQSRLGFQSGNVPPGPWNSRHQLFSSPTQMPQYCSAAPSFGSSNNAASHSNWLSFSPPHRNGPIVRNSGPPAMFWPQTRPPIRPHSALPNNLPPRSQPQPFWHAQSPPQPHPLPPHSPQIQFNLQISPPPTNQFNY